MPLRHLVFLSLNESENIQEIEQGLKAVTQLVNGVSAFYFGRCEEVTGQYNYSFFIDFENEQARQGYLDHPQHTQVAVKTIIPKLKGPFEKSVLVFDYQKKVKPATTVTYFQNEQYTKGYFLTRAAGAIGTTVISGIHDKKVLENCTVENFSWGFNKALRLKLNSTASASQPHQQDPDTLFLKLFHQKNRMTQVAQEDLPPATLASTFQK